MFLCVLGLDFRGLRVVCVMGFEGLWFFLYEWRRELVEWKRLRRLFWFTWSLL